MKKVAVATGSFLAFLLSRSLTFAQATTIKIERPDIVKITDFGKLISSIVGIALTLATIAAFVFLIWGGIQWIISGGDKAGVETAQNRIQAALLGLLIVFAVWALFTVVGRFLGLPDIFNLVIPSAAN